MGGLEPWHWVVIAIVVAGLFFSNKLPDAARSLGRSLRIFKTEIKGMAEDDKKRDEAREPEQPKALPPADLVKREAVPPQPTQQARPRPSPRS